MPGGPEIMVIVLLALLVLGPQQLPKAMRTFGNVMAEIRKVSSSFQAEMRSALDVIETDAKPATPADGSTPADGPTASGVEEVVARNPATDTDTGTDTGTRPDPDGEPATGSGAGGEDAARPRIDPADRAAG